MASMEDLARLLADNSYERGRSISSEIRSTERKIKENEKLQARYDKEICAIQMIRAQISPSLDKVNLYIQPFADLVDFHKLRRWMGGDDALWESAPEARNEGELMSNYPAQILTDRLASIESGDIESASTLKKEIADANILLGELVISSFNIKPEIEQYDASIVAFNAQMQRLQLMPWHGEINDFTDLLYLTGRPETHIAAGMQKYLTDRKEEFGIATIKSYTGTIHGEPNLAITIERHHVADIGFYRIHPNTEKQLNGVLIRHYTPEAAGMIASYAYDILLK